MCGPKSFHIFGNGISGSRSPQIHNAAFAHYRLPYHYDIRESDNIDGVSHLIRDRSFGGASVTMPHKLQVHRFCDQQSDSARLIGAINTLTVIEGAGSDEKMERLIQGENTDWSGLYSIMSNYISGRDKRARVGLVIGAGGAARAGVYAMHKAGLQSIFIFNRTILKAEKIAKEFQDVCNLTVVRKLQELQQAPDVILGTIPGDVTTENWFSTLFKKQHGLCIEMSYKPRVTPLLLVAQRKPGWICVDGLEVLLQQAFDQSRLWTGQPAPEEVMRSAIIEQDVNPGDVAKANCTTVVN